MSVGDYLMNFECKKSVAEPGAEEQLQIEGLYEFTNKNGT
jgi:hypothetical protein